MQDLCGLALGRRPPAASRRKLYQQSREITIVAQIFTKPKPQIYPKSSLSIYKVYGWRILQGLATWIGIQHQSQHKPHQETCWYKKVLDLKHGQNQLCVNWKIIGFQPSVAWCMEFHAPMQSTSTSNHWGICEANLSQVSSFPFTS